MDSERFDTLTRVLTSRRTALGGLLGGRLAVLLGLGASNEVTAHNPVPACKQLKDPKRRRACLGRARAHNRRHQQSRCVPDAAATTCAGRCGTAANNCGLAVTCPDCLPGKSCLNNGSCGTMCVSNAQCTTDCRCSFVSVEGARHCITIFGPCENIAQVCTSTTQCPLGRQCQDTTCGPGGSSSNRCVPLCPS